MSSLGTKKKLSTKWVLVVTYDGHDDYIENILLITYNARVSNQTYEQFFSTKNKEGIEYKNFKTL